MTPYVVSLVLDERSQALFDDLRRVHFPADRLVVGAHVTVFHALPEHLPVVDTVATLDAPQFPVVVTGVRHLGRGVAFDLSSPPAERLRSTLVDEWGPQLTAQDRQRWRPHVTIQNKVPAEAARRLHAELSARPLPAPATAQGLAVWRYVGGPWEHVHTHRFVAGA